MPSTTEIIRALPAVEECAGNLVYGFSGLAQILLGSGLAASILSSLPYVGIFIGISHILKYCIFPSTIDAPDGNRREKFEDDWDCLTGSILISFAAAPLLPVRLAYPILPYLGFWMKSYLDFLGAIAIYRSQDEDSSEAIISSRDFKNLIEKALIFTGWTALALPLMLSISAVALSGTGFAFLAMGGLLGLFNISKCCSGMSENNRAPGPSPHPIYGRVPVPSPRSGRHYLDEIPNPDDDSHRIGPSYPSRNPSSL